VVPHSRNFTDYCQFLTIIASIKEALLDAFFLARLHSVFLRMVAR